MMDVLHVPAFQDNYIWLIRRGRDVAIVDPGNAEPVIAALERERLRPIAVLCTHHHRDHVGGADELGKRYGVSIFGPAGERIPACTHALDEGSRVELAGLHFDVFATPGHTLGHIMFYGHGLLFCGDTLFSAGCGRLFEGTPQQMHASLSRVAALPGETKVYCGHEYTEANLRFAQAVEPNNPDIRARLDHVRQLRAQGLPTLPSTIADEMRINPFLRCHIDAVRRAAQTHDGRSMSSDVEIFASIRRWKDGFRE
jgi:hydroxyacylglutathione hydrolase